MFFSLREKEGKGANKENIDFLSP